MGYKISPFLSRMTSWVLGLVLSVQLGTSSLAQAAFTQEQREAGEYYLQRCLILYQAGYQKLPIPDILDIVMGYHSYSECDFDFETLSEFKKSKKRHYKELATRLFNQKMQRVDQMLQEMGWIKLPPDSQIEAFLKPLPAPSAKTPSLPNQVFLHPPFPPEESTQSIAAQGVTQGLWVEVMGNNPSHFKERKYYFEDQKYFQKKEKREKTGRFMKLNQVRTIITKDGPREVQLNPDLPVENVSWASAKMMNVDAEQKKNSVAEFLEHLNVVFEEAQRPDFFGLPKEKQWEWAARGGTVSKYVTGDDEMESREAQARLAKYTTSLDNSDQDLSRNPFPSGGRQTHPVDEREPNQFGFYRSSVWEWTEDLYSNEGSDRVSRGGGWFNGAKFFHSSGRSLDFPDDCSRFLGFRLLRTLE